MTIDELVKVLDAPDRLRIVKDKQQIYVGYIGTIGGGTKNVKWETIGLTGTESVKRFRLEPELSHKKYKELHLLPPYEPERAAQYEFKDLQLSIYYTIHI
jgi:hypothetical protein